MLPISIYNNTTLTPPADYAGGGGGSGYETIVGELVNSSGNPVQVAITFHINETTLPAAYGPAVDLDGVGGMDSTDITAGAGYKVLPCQLTLTFQNAKGTETRQMFIMLGEKN